MIEASLYPKALSCDNSNDSSRKGQTPELAFCQALFTSQSLKTASLWPPNTPGTWFHRGPLTGEASWSQLGWRVFRSLSRSTKPQRPICGIGTKGRVMAVFPFESGRFVTETEQRTVYLKGRRKDGIIPIDQSKMQLWHMQMPEQGSQLSQERKKDRGLLLPHDLTLLFLFI